MSVAGDVYRRCIVNGGEAGGDACLILASRIPHSVMTAVQAAADPRWGRDARTDWRSTVLGGTVQAR